MGILQSVRFKISSRYGNMTGLLLGLGLALGLGVRVAWSGIWVNVRDSVRITLWTQLDLFL